LDASHNNMNQHAMMLTLKSDEHFKERVAEYAQKYSL
jgi:hypothetical protein